MEISYLNAFFPAFYIRNEKQTRWFEKKKMQDISALLLPRNSNTWMTSIFTQHLFHEFHFPVLNKNTV